MDQKYDNFRELVNRNLPGSAITYVLSAMSLHSFLIAILHQRQSNPLLPGEKIADRIMQKLHLSPAQFPSAELDKFERYCDYFNACVDQLFL